MKKSSTFLKNLTRSRSQRTLHAISFVASLVIAVNFWAISQAGVAPIAPLAADAFVDSVGVVTHLGYPDTPYGQNWGKADPSQDVKLLLANLGIRHVRDGISHPTLQPWSLAAINRSIVQVPDRVMVLYFAPVA